jgi:hypothetical protein
MWPKLFEFQVPSSNPPKESQNILFPYARMAVTGDADARVKQTRGWSGQTKVLNQSLPLFKNALDTIIATQIYWNLHVQNPAPHERPFCKLLFFPVMLYMQKNGNSHINASR